MWKLCVHDSKEQVRAGQSWIDSVGVVVCRLGIPNLLARGHGDDLVEPKLACYPLCFRGSLTTSPQHDIVHLGPLTVATSSVRLGTLFCLLAQH